MPEPHLMNVDEAPELFADAVLVDAYDKLLFISLWGRDTALQEFLARITLSQDDEGLQIFFLTADTKASDEPRRQRVVIGETRRLDHYSGRMPSQNLFGDLAHLWIFDRLVAEPDLSNRRTIALFREERLPANEVTVAAQRRIWQVTKSLCHLPLLDHWAATVIDTFYQRNWIKDLHGIAVNGAMIDLSLGEEIEDEISTLIREGALTLN